MINKEKARKLADKRVAEEDLGNQVLMLIGKVTMQVAVDYYGYESIDDLIENDNMSDEDFNIFMSVIRECMTDAIMNALP